MAAEAEMVTEEKKKPFEQWAILELMGHRRLAGRITEVHLFGTVLLMIEVPQWGKTVTQIYAHSAIYGITLVSEEMARADVARYPSITDTNLLDLIFPGGIRGTDYVDPYDLPEGETPEESFRILLNSDNPNDDTQARRTNAVKFSLGSPEEALAVRDAHEAQSVRVDHPDWVEQLAAVDPPGRKLKPNYSPMVNPNWPGAPDAIDPTTDTTGERYDNA